MPVARATPSAPGACALLRVGEGYIAETYLVLGGKEALLAAIDAGLERELAELGPERFPEIGEARIRERSAAIRAAVEAHNDWSVGSYRLDAEDTPIGDEWNLLIVAAADAPLIEV